MFSLYDGERFEWDGTGWTYNKVGRGADSLLFTSEDGRSASLSRLDLLIAINRGTHRYDDSYAGARNRATESLISRIPLLSESQITTASVRWYYVNAVLAAYQTAWPVFPGERLLRRLALPASLERHPSYGTVVMWLQRFLESDRDVSALIPAFKRRSKKVGIDRTSQKNMHFNRSLNNV